ncbi:MAG: hypothetical protein JSR09_07515 [Bacteroidetes bacterium]|nr:hypothetical protein [Bacteroidota bacterium]MBS1649540.1 hypothetical protein [Bacteroidota bacterium]
MHISIHKWLRIAFINLLIVSILGIILRYKIAFSLPFIEQKKILHAHSHFAFAGWITQALMFLLIKQLKHTSLENNLAKYKTILWANLITAYGMLLTFPWEGYGLYSIIFSALSVFVSYWFAIVFWRDLNKQAQPKIAHKWFKAAVTLNAISSIGAFSLGYLMMNKIMTPKLYLSAIYFFLHFQYNGWFFFACMGLLMVMMEDLITDKKKLLQVFYFFLIASVPAFFLSALWLNIPFVLYLIVLITAIMQLIGWFYITEIIRKNKNIFSQINSTSKILFILSAVALTIKLLLQAFSTIPSLSQLAFGFRPIIIGYLHLVLLGVITIFLFAYTTNFEMNFISTKLKKGIIIFVAGIILNEVILMLQGSADLGYVSIPYLNELLFVVALILFSGLAVINFSFSRKNKLP